jgi:hypothetical protein
MRLFFINMLAVLLIAGPVAAAENLTPLSEKLYYEAGFAGVLFGKIGIEIEQNPDKAKITCDIASSGILALFLKHSSHTTLEASGSNFTYPDRTYTSNYHTRKKARSVKLVYKNGKIETQHVQPPNDREKRPAVPESDINKAYDLMAFLLQMRKEIADARKSGKTAFSINSYDGRRLTQADFNIGEEKVLEIAGQKVNTLSVTARRKPLAGYSKGEIEDIEPNEPSMTIYFTNDDKLTPLRMEVPFMMQKISATLIKQCGPEESCLLGISG